MDSLHQTKICTKCGEQKSLDKYFRRTRTVDGYYYICKDCFGTAYKKARKRKYAVNEKYFEHIESADQAYWLGFMAADGNVKGNLYSFRITLHKRDKKHIKKFLRSIQSEAKVKIVQDKFSYASVHSLKMCKDLVRHGIEPNKFSTVKPWQTDSHELLHHYWRGVIDGDGFLVIYNRKFNPQKFRTMIGLTCNKYMVFGFKDYILEQLGIDSNPRQAKNTTWDVRYGSHEDTKRIAKLLYGQGGIRLDRKDSVAQKIISSPLSTHDIYPDEIIEEIRYACTNNILPQKYFCEKYGISSAQVSRIVNYKTRKGN